MAKKPEAPKIVLERNYNIPLRRETLKVPYYKKAKKAVKAVREFISKHMKSDDVSIGMHLNLAIWKHGMKNPPGMVKVTATKDDKGKVLVNSVDAPKPKVEEKPTKKVVKKEETKATEAKEKKAEEAKKIEKKEIKELKKVQQKPIQKAPIQAKNIPKQPTAPQSQ